MAKKKSGKFNENQCQNGIRIEGDCHEPEMDRWWKIRKKLDSVADFVWYFDYLFFAHSSWLSVLNIVIGCQMKSNCIQMMQ